MDNDAASRKHARIAATAAFLVALGLVAWLGGRAPGVTSGVSASTGAVRARGEAPAAPAPVEGTRGGLARVAGAEVDPDLGFRLVDATDAVGVDFVHSRPELDAELDSISPHVAGLGAAVSVADANRDGWPDLYFVSSRFGTANALYLNRRDGTLEDVAAEVGVADLNVEGRGASMGSVWGDYDNDGDEDLFVYKWGRQQLLENRLEPEGVLRFEDVSEGSGLDRWMNTNGAVWFDYDRDGLLDLYLTNYFREEVDLWNLTTTRIMQESWEFADNGGVNRLFHNEGDGRFRDVTEETGVGSTRWSLAAAAADFDGDGWQDLYLANDYGPEELYRNLQGERFELQRGLGMSDDSKSGMSVSLGDVENRGRLDVFVTNISEPGYLLQGNNLRMNLLSEAETFINVAEGPVADAGWAWGAQFGDLDNDGDVELFVTNGFISASQQRDYWYGMSKIAGAAGPIFEDAANWPEIGDASLSGYERSRLLLNNGAGFFVDVAERAGVTDTYDGRAVAFVDLFNRGVLDAVVANQGGPALVYLNRVQPGRHWIALDLRGATSNRSAIGAEVTVEFGGRALRQVVDGGMGFCSQNDRRLHFGLGEAQAAERVVIRWPSGREQVLTDLEADRLHRIVEQGAAAGPATEAS